MELVPILSTIILVGTIATFILAVAAYILYKIREGRAQEKRATERQARPEPHVLVAPQQRPAISAREEEMYMTPGQRREQAARSEWEGTAQAPRQQQEWTERQAPPQRPTYGASRRSPEPREEPRQESLFWEYTDEGFVPVRPEESRREEGAEQENENDDGYAWL